MQKDTIPIQFNSFMNLIDRLSSSRSSTGHMLIEALFAVNSFREFERVFQERIKQTIVDIIGQVNVPNVGIEDSMDLRAVLGLSEGTVQEWSIGLTRLLTDYGLLSHFSAGETLALAVVSDVINAMKIKADIKQLYLSAMIKKWVKQKRGGNLPFQWYEIRDGKVLTTDLQLSDMDMKTAAKRFTELVKEFKPTAIIKLADISADDVGKKTIKGCTEYLVSKTN